MNIEMSRRRKPRTAGGIVALSVLTLMLAGCQTRGTQAPVHTGSIGSTATVTPSDLTPQQALQEVQKWGSAYTRNEKDKAAALNYAASLRAAGETNQAVAVMRKAAIYHPNDREVLAGYGKALAADGQFREALATIRRAQRSDNPDWQLLAAEGGILDSLGQQKEARDRYRQALILAPGEPQILNNLAMSYVLTNELDRAEEVLREAAADPKATLKTRQNLALVQSLRAEAAGGGAAPGPVLGITGINDSSPAPEGAVLQQDTWAELAQSG